MLSSDSAMAYLTDDEERLRSLELRGHSSIDMSGAIEGGLQSMDARDINLEYAEDGETLEHAVLAGGGVMQLAGANGQPGRRIAGRSDRRHGRPRRRGHVTGRARQSRVFATRIQGRPQAGDSRREHERRRRARQGPHRRAVQPGTWSSARSARAPRHASRGRGPCRSCLAPTAASTRRTLRAARTFEDGVTKADALEARYLVAQGQLLLSGEVKTPAADGDRRPHPGRGHDHRPDLRWPEDDRQGQRAERQPAGQEGRRQKARPTCRAC